MKNKLSTAPQILEHYLQRAWILDCVPDCEVEAILKAMRRYARVKSDIAYELGYQTALKQLTK